MSRPTPALVAACWLIAASSDGVAQKLDRAPALTHPDDLAVGPVRARLQVRPGKGEKAAPQEAVVLFLTKSQVAYVAVDADGKAVGDVVAKGADYVDSVNAPSVGRFWAAGGDKQFTGPAYLKDADPIDTKSVATGKAELTTYLTIRAEYLHLSLDLALSARDEVGVAAAVAAGREFATVVRAEGLAGQLPLGVFDLQKYADRQAACVKRADECVRELEKKKLENEQLLRLAAREAEARSRVAALQTLLGGGLAVLTDDDALKRAGVRVAAAGLGDIGGAALQREKHAALIWLLEQSDEADARAGLTKELDAFRGNQADLAGLLPAKLVRADAVEELLRKKDRAGAVAALAARVQATATGGRPNPLILCEKLRLQARLLLAGGDDAARRGKDLEKLAREAVAAVKSVPPGPAFDGDRTRVLVAAATLVHQSVTETHGPYTWSKCFAPLADYGVRVLDAASGFKDAASDPDGEARALRAWLLFQRGLVKEAAHQADEVRELRKWDATTQFNAARIYGARRATATENADRVRHVEVGLGCLQQAVRAGFRNIKIATTDTDIGALRLENGDPQLVKQQRALWKHLTAPVLTATIEAVRHRGNKYTYSIQIENSSPFPLTDVLFTYQVANKTITREAPFIGPNSKYVLTDTNVPQNALLLMSSPNVKEVRINVKNGPVEFAYPRYGLFR